MRYFTVFVLALLLYSCSDDSNPTNNLTTEKDSLIYSFDSISVWSNSSGTQSTGNYWTDTTIKKIRVYFTGETDEDSTKIEFNVRTSNGILFDYIKIGKTDINASHINTIDIPQTVYFSTSFYVFKYGPGSSDIRHITLKFIKVFKIY
jgi:hypothetical protein